MNLLTDYKDILNQIESIHPELYCHNRNYVNGNVSMLSPYISRGVISTKMVYESILTKKYKYYKVEKFLQELAWRDYFQRTHQYLEKEIYNSIKQNQPDVHNHKIPSNILSANTGIKAIDNEITKLYQSGYLHNHSRMYLASIICNIAKCYWEKPSEWLYYHLLDADVASNTCSWQWVAASFSSKKYYANQENINKFLLSNENNTYLDKDYETIRLMPIPNELKELSYPVFSTILPESKPFELDNSKPVLLYNAYNLDPLWHLNENVERILLLEPSHFKKLPMCNKTIEFIISLFNNNIQHSIDPKIFVGEYNSLKEKYNINSFIFKEHPLFVHYEGKMDERDWMFPNIKGYFSSFFKYWKLGEKYIPKTLMNE